MRAFFAEGVDNMHIPWAVEGLPTLLHLSLFLFFGGLAIFLFDVDREVFSYVVWWIGLFCLVYGMITLLPLIRQDSPYNSPLSTPAWFMATTAHLIFNILYAIIVSCFYCNFRYLMIHFGLMGKDYRRRVLGGVEMVVEEAVSKRLSKIDISILDWTITSLGDDDSLKNFFEAIPGFFKSKLVKHLKGDIPEELRNKYEYALYGFLDRNLSSNSVNDSEKLRRLDISVKAVDWMRDSDLSSILRNILFEHWDKVPHTLETGQSLAYLCTSNNDSNAYHARVIVARILASAQEFNGKWIRLASGLLGLPEQDLREDITFGLNSVSLALLIHVTRRCHRFYYSSDMEVLRTLPQFDICQTLPRLRRDFCTLWNDIVQQARDRGPKTVPVFILYEIRRPYIALHQGTDAAPTAFSASTSSFASILLEPSSYSLCNVASHLPDSDFIAQIPVPDSRQLLPPTRQAELVKNVVEPPSTSNPTTTSEIGATSYGPDTTRLANPTRFSPRPIGASSTATASVAATPQDIASTTTSSHPLEGSEHQDIVAPSAEPGTSQILFTASTHTLAPRLAPIPTSPPNTPSGSYNAGVASVRVSNSSQVPPPSIGSSIPASRPTDSATLRRLHARGLVNSRNICFVNAVLQLLINLPPFLNLFRELGDLKGQRGVGVPETGGGATPLVDATMRFFKKFMVEEQPSAEQQSQAATGGTLTAEKEKNLVDSFEPTYMYDAMKEKRQLKPLLVRSRARVAASSSS
jgi:hypothetical protein